MEQIANVLGMSETTLYDKKGKFSEFSQAIKRGKDKGIASITSALFTKARKLVASLCQKIMSKLKGAKTKI